LPFLSKMSETYGWFTQEDIGNMLAVSESTPGPIGVNMATYVGNMVGAAHGGNWIGMLCGLLSTLSLVLPSYLVILAVQKLMSRFSENCYVQGAMQTLRPASVGMVSAAVLGVLESALLDLGAMSTQQWSDVVLIPNILLFLVIFVLYQRFNKLHPIVFLALGAVVGIVFRL